MHPRCGNCVKHGVLCDFGNPDVLEELVVPPVVTTTTTTTADNFGAPTPTTLNAPKTPSLRASPAATPKTPLFHQPRLSATSSSLAGQFDRMLELRLLHHYTTVTSETLLVDSPATVDIWRREVPQMAFSGKTYLADAILSVAALHLRTQHPEDKALIRASHAYAASTLAEYCASLNAGITAENAEALFLTANLIAFQATASRIFIKDDGDVDPSNPLSRYALPLPWFHAFQGVKTMVATSWQWICHSTTVKMVIEAQPSFQLDLNPQSPSSFFGHLLEDLEEEIASEDPGRVSITVQAYAHAVCVINWAHKNHHPAASLAFPATVSRRFIELVEEKRPRALSILACFFALLKRLDAVWWLHDVSRREVMGLVGLFEPGSKWWKHLEWPIRLALWEGAVIPAEVWGAEFEPEVPRPEPYKNTMLQHIEMMSQMLNTSQDLPPVPIPDEPDRDPYGELDKDPYGEPYLRAESPD